MKALGHEGVGQTGIHWQRRAICTLKILSDTDLSSRSIPAARERWAVHHKTGGRRAHSSLPAFARSPAPHAERPDEHRLNAGHAVYSRRRLRHRTPCPFGSTLAGSQAPPGPGSPIYRHRARRTSRAPSRYPLLLDALMKQFASLSPFVAFQVLRAASSPLPPSF